MAPEDLTPAQVVEVIGRFKQKMIELSQQNEQVPAAIVTAAVQDTCHRLRTPVTAFGGRHLGHLSPPLEAAI